MYWYYDPYVKCDPNIVYSRLVFDKRISIKSIYVNIARFVPTNVWQMVIGAAWDSPWFRNSHSQKSFHIDDWKVDITILVSLEQYALFKIDTKVVVINCVFLLHKYT